MVNKDDRRVTDPTHEDYGKSQDEPTNMELTAQREKITALFSETVSLGKDLDFLSGKKVDFNGTEVTLETPSRAFFDGPQNNNPTNLDFRRVGSGTGIYDSNDPNKMDFAHISTSGSHTTLAALFHPTKEQTMNVMALEAALIKTAGKHDHIHKLLSIESYGGLRNHKKFPRDHPYAPARKKANMLRNKNAAFTKEIEWAPLTDQCSNCRQYGHTVIECWGPTDIHGLIDVCPCNGRNHRADQCEIVKKWSNLIKYKIFYINRIGLPQFKHHQSFVHMIVHDPIIHDLHQIVKQLFRRGCRHDQTLSWRYNPLTTNFGMKVWNETKPWTQHDYNKPQERWCNVPDPAYKEEDWLNVAAMSTPLNPLEQSWINNRTTKDLPGLEQSWKKAHKYRNTLSATVVAEFQAYMHEWLCFYNTIANEDTPYMEFLVQTLSKLPEEELQNLCTMGATQIDNDLAGMYEKSKAQYLPAKPGLGVPRVPQDLSQMICPFFTPSGANAAPTQQPTVPTGSGTGVEKVVMTEESIAKLLHRYNSRSGGAREIVHVSGR